MKKRIIKKKNFVCCSDSGCGAQAKHMREPWFPRREWKPVCEHHSISYKSLGLRVVDIDTPPEELKEKVFKCDCGWSGTQREMFHRDDFGEGWWLNQFECPKCGDVKIDSYGKDVSDI